MAVQWLARPNPESKQFSGTIRVRSGLSSLKKNLTAGAWLQNAAAAAIAPRVANAFTEVEDC